MWMSPAGSSPSATRLPLSRVGIAAGCAWRMRTRRHQRLQINLNGRRCGTLEFSKGAVHSCCIYDKTKEITVSRKDWMQEVWRRNGWDGEVARHAGRVPLQARMSERDGRRRTLCHARPAGRAVGVLHHAVAAAHHPHRGHQPGPLADSPPSGRCAAGRLLRRRRASWCGSARRQGDLLLDLPDARRAARPPQRAYSRRPFRSRTTGRTSSSGSWTWQEGYLQKRACPTRTSPRPSASSWASLSSRQRPREESTWNCGDARSPLYNAQADSSCRQVALDT